MRKENKPLYNEFVKFKQLIPFVLQKQLHNIIINECSCQEGKYSKR